MLRLHVLCVSVLLDFGHCLVMGQDANRVFLPNQEVRVHELPALTAPSKNKTAVLSTELEITFRDKTVCCGKDSALEDAVLSDPASLKELGARLQGRHWLSDGRPILVSADYVPRASVTPGLILAALMEQHAPLVEWKSHFYVLYGAIFNETLATSGRDYAIHKLLLLDPRFSDGRREVVFDREVEDWEKIGGLLIPVVRPQ